jgi:hypothetical protein
MTNARSQPDGHHARGMGFSRALDKSLQGLPLAENPTSSVDGRFADKFHGDETVSSSTTVSLGTSQRSPLTVSGPSISDSLNGLILQAQPLLQAGSSTLGSTPLELKARVPHVLVTARSLLSRFISWPFRLPNYWLPRTVQSLNRQPATFGLDLFPGEVHVYSDCQSCAALQCHSN